MKKYWIGSLFLSILIITLLLFYRANILNQTNSEEELHQSIQQLIPEGSLLRDFEKVPGTNESYLVIYVSPGYTFNSWDFSCPGMILHDSIIGEYHLSLVQDNKIVNDLVIPPAPYQDEGKLEMVYKHKFSNEEPVDIKTEDRKVVKLLSFKDLTGDGRPLEFLLTTTGGGCGFFERITGAYDPDVNMAVFYSDWIERFNPNENGDFYYLFECGDHGNTTREEAKYRFDENLKKFDKYWEKSTPCTS